VVRTSSGSSGLPSYGAKKPKSGAPPLIAESLKWATDVTFAHASTASIWMTNAVTMQLKVITGGNVLVGDAEGVLSGCVTPWSEKTQPFLTTVSAGGRPFCS